MTSYHRHRAPTRPGVFLGRPATRYVERYRRRPRPASDPDGR